MTLEAHCLVSERGNVSVFILATIQLLAARGDDFVQGVMQYCDESDYHIQVFSFSHSSMDKKRVDLPRYNG